jgi:hypothetical protein
MFISSLEVPVLKKGSDITTKRANPSKEARMIFLINSQDENHPAFIVSLIPPMHGFTGTLTPLGRREEQRK